VSTKSGANTELQYYVYIQNDWRGPYPLIQIKTMLRQKDVTEETYVYEPQHQSQVMIKDLLKGGLGSSAARTAVHTGNEDARTQDRIDHALGAVQQFREVCMALPQLSGAAHDQSLNDLHHARGIIQEGFTAARQRVADLRTLGMQLDKAASDIATRRHDERLTQLLVDLRESISHAAADEILLAAEKIVAQMAHVAEHAPEEDPFSAYETAAPQVATAAGTGRTGLVESARFELKHLQDDLSSIKGAYAKLQETYAKERDHNRRLLVQLKEQLESEQKSHEGDIAELRALAAEIHDLACSAGLSDEDAVLAEQVRKLAAELQNTVPTLIVPVAESVLNGMVNSLGSQREELRRQVGELTQSRSDLLAARSEMSLLRQREEALQADKTRLQKQLDEARGAASKVDQSARAREHQLRSTIAALQVTKELHQEVMEDLKGQLKQAQERVGTMETELTTARDELKGTRSSFEMRELELQASLKQLSEDRAKLEERRAQLSGNLQSAEAELAKARAKADQSAEDESLAEALAAKVNQLRSTFEQTKAKLREQEASAGKMQEELGAARHEAAELRSRSEALGQELDGARGNLEAARKRMEELQRAAARLESEREALSQELSERKDSESTQSGDGVRADPSHLQRITAELEARTAASAARGEQLASELANERARTAELDAARRAAQSRADDLAAERERLAGELAALRGAGGQEARAEAVEERLASTERALRDAAEARSDLQARLSQAAAERDRLAGELLRLKQEHEAAAVEHRAALAASRRAQAETLARSAELQAGLDSARAERERLAEELARGDREKTSTFTAGESRLAEATRRLASEGERAETLARELEDARREAAGAAARRDTLAAELTEAAAERDRLERQLRERERQAADQAQADAGERTRLQEAMDRLREQLTREQARAIELDRRSADARDEARSSAGRHAQSAEAYAEAVAASDRLAGELAQARARHVTELADAERRLQAERDRFKQLETELAAAHGNVAGLQARHGGLEQNLAAITAERDRLASQLAQADQQRDGRDHAVADLSRRLAEEQARLAVAQGELAAARKELDAAHGHRDGVSAALATTSARHGNLAVEVERLAGELQRVLAEREAARVEHEAALSAVKRQLEAERQRFSDLTSRFTSAQGEHARASDGAAAIDGRMAQADAERARALAEIERLRAELSAASASATSGRDAERLGRELAELRRVLDARSESLIKTEAELQIERERLARIDAEREQLRQQVAAGSGDRAALAEVTAARDRLAADLQRLQGDLERMKREDRGAELRATIERAEGQIAAERSRITTLEAELGLARSQQQVATASREGLENQLAKTVADRERLLGEVDRLRHELDQARGRLVSGNPDQAVELGALKRLLAAEQERVKELETKLIQAYREQGENSALTDDALRSRLTRATSRIRRLKEKLRDQRRKTETSLQEAEQAKTELTRLRQRGTSSLARSAVSPMAAGEAHPLDLDASSAIRPSVDASSHHALEPGKPASGSGSGSSRIGLGSGSSPSRRPELDAGGFISAFGRPAVAGATRANPLATTLATVTERRGSGRLLTRRRKQLIGVAGIVGGVCLTGLLLAAGISSLFVPCGQAVVNARIEALKAPLEGRLEQITRVPGDQVSVGEIIGRIDRRTQAQAALEAENRQLAVAQKASDESETRAQTLERDIAAVAAQIAQERERILGDLEKKREKRWDRINTLAAQVQELEQVVTPVADTQTTLAAAKAELVRLKGEDEADAQQIARLQQQADLDSTITSLNGRLARVRTEAARTRSEASLASGDLEKAKGRVAEAERVLRESVSIDIHSPVDGTIAKWLIDADRTMTTGSPLAQIALPDSIFVEAVLPDGAESGVHEGDRAEIQLLANDHRLSGTVRRVLPPGQALESGSYLHPTGILRDRRHRAMIALDPGSMGALGQGARIVIIGREPGVLKRGLLRLYSAVLL
jgi:chromosome segregation ATPase